MAQPDGTWVPKEVFLPSGHQFGQSKTPHLDSALTFAQGQRGTAGPAVLRDPQLPSNQIKLPEISLPDSLDPKAAAFAVAALAVGVITTVIVVKNRHRIKTWWDEVALPKLVSGALWLMDLSPEDLKAVTAEVGPISTVEFSSEVAVVVDDLRENMTSEEAQRRLLLVLLAASIISENMRKLQNARIADDDFAALQSAMGRLTSGEVVDLLNSILGGERRVLDDETEAHFVRVFGGGHLVDGTYQPLDIDKIEEALRLPPPGEDERDEDPPFPPQISTR
jgi:hypothetical protein